MANQMIQPPTVPLELWRELYQAAAAFQVLAPWRWMHDDHAFGINNQFGVRLLSVLGFHGQVFGLATYRGTAGVNYLLRLLAEQFEPETEEGIYYQDSLLLDFFPRHKLRQPDRKVLAQLQFKAAPTRPRLYPAFFSLKPGLVPWFINEAEARELLDDLRHLLPFAELARAHPELFGSRKPGEIPFVPPAPASPLAPEQLEWHTITPVPPPADPPVQPEAFDLAAALRAPQTSAVWELTAFYSSARIYDGLRPFYPKLALCVDALTGFIITQHLGGPDQTRGAVAATAWLQAVQTTRQRPASVKVDSLDLARTLAPLGARLGLQFIPSKSLPMAEEARHAIEAFQRQA